MEILGLIPARAGSKGIPKKNLALLAGRPLIEYTFEAARQATQLSRVVVTTDDPAVVALAGERGVEAPFLRPAELARDDTPMLDVLRHAIRWLREAEGYDGVLVVLLQPTSPLRTGRDVDATVTRLLETGADVAVSVVEVPHNFVPESLLVADGVRLRPFLPGRPSLRRQDKFQFFARNGPAVVAARTRYIESCGHLYEGFVVGYQMGARESIDIDTPEDLREAESLLLQSGPVLSPPA